MEEVVVGHVLVPSCHLRALQGLPVNVNRQRNTEMPPGASKDHFITKFSMCCSPEGLPGWDVSVSVAEEKANALPC